MNLHTKAHKLKRIFLAKQLIHSCELVNRADGVSEIEGEGRRGDRASRAASEFKFVSSRVVQFRVQPYLGKFPVTPHRYA